MRLRDDAVAVPLGLWRRRLLGSVSGQMEYPTTMNARVIADAAEDVAAVRARRLYQQRDVGQGAPAAPDACMCGPTAGRLRHLKPGWIISRFAHVGKTFTQNHSLP